MSVKVIYRDSNLDQLGNGFAEYTAVIYWQSGSVPDVGLAVSLDLKALGWGITQSNSEDLGSGSYKLILTVALNAPTTANAVIVKEAFESYLMSKGLLIYSVVQLKTTSKTSTKKTTSNNSAGNNSAGNNSAIELANQSGIYSQIETLLGSAGLTITTAVIRIGLILLLKKR